MDARQMRARIKAITKSFRKEGEVVEVADKNSLAFKVGTLLGQARVDKRVAEAFGLVMDLDVLTPYNNVASAAGQVNLQGVQVKYLKPLVAVVPLIAYAGHTYEVNVPVIMSAIGGFLAYNKRGQLGSSLATTSISNIRLATDVEIESLSEAQINAMIDEYS